MLRTDLQRHNENLGIPLFLKATGRLSPNVVFFFPTSENILFSISCNDTLGNTGLACCIHYALSVVWWRKTQKSTFEHYSFLTLFSFDHKTKLSSLRVASIHASWQKVQRIPDRVFLSTLPTWERTEQEELTFLYRFSSCALSFPAWHITDRVGSF